MDGDERRKKAMQRILLRIALFFVCSVVLFFALSIFGCVTLGRDHGRPDVPLVAPVTEVHAVWANEIAVTADVVHKGTPLPGLAGRLYLFGADPGHPVKANGKVVVDVFEGGRRAPDESPRMLGRWQFDKDNLNRLLKRDMIGWGYTLFLPWPEYQPGIQRLEMKVCYQPDEGGLVFAPPAVVSVRPRETDCNAWVRTEVPGRQPPVPSPEVPEAVITGAEAQEQAKK